LIALPAYIDPEAWAGFVEMRRAMPKSRPFTLRAATLILKELQRIKDAGHCPNAALDQSTLNGWTDVYQPKEKALSRAGKHLSDWDRHQEAQKTHQPVNGADVAKVAAKALQAIRRVS
jgi:hypothetical protein